MKRIVLLSLLCVLPFLSIKGEEIELVTPLFGEKGEYYPEFSTAGFFSVPDNPRQAHQFNLGWRYFKGSLAGAEAMDHDDLQWEVVNIPHGLELVPEESSGCSNYQGEAWYRKHFIPPASLKGKKVTLYFEAIMGKSKIYLNGRLIKENFGGFLPIIVDVGDLLEYGKTNIVAVMADNSNDPEYPPGKPQTQLDFNYFGGIYRDVYLIETNKVHVTDANQVNIEAGGGVFFYTKSLNLKERSAEVGVKVHIANENTEEENLYVHVSLSPRGEEKSKDGYSAEITIRAGESFTLDKEWVARDMDFWSPDAPYLYDLKVEILNSDNELLDAFRKRVGIRTFEMTSDKGLILNGKPFSGKLIGGNRHQDFAYLGNAVPNIGQWRDAKKLRASGLRVVRSAHYPLDPAFMDAADEMGLFVIVATPGWQFWNNKPEFAERVYSDIRNMVRRDRNHPCVWMWEPILNETHYPEDFAGNAYDITHREFPYPSCYAACDSGERGAERFDLIYAHPELGAGTDRSRKTIPNKPYFTREFGDNVDNWSAHNSSSRAHRKWGEIPQLIQAVHYTKPSYVYTSWDTLFKSPSSHIGGALWHPFDHQRGYHPDPFYGGIMDAFRQPKMSRYAFEAQRPIEGGVLPFFGPSVYIAHEMTPFSPKDVTVFSNCEEVRLSGLGMEPQTQKVHREDVNMPAPPVVFKDVYGHQIVKELTRGGKGKECYFLAEGLIGGEVVTSHRMETSRRATQIKLTLDNEGVPLKANGTDFAVVVASMMDGNGNIKRLNNEYITFSIEGEGCIIGDENISANPRPVEWGTAPLMIRTTNKPGKVKITAHVRNEGSQKPKAGILEFETVPAQENFIQSEVPSYKIAETGTKGAQTDNSILKKRIEQLEKELNLYKNKEVERQQSEFEYPGN